VAPLYLRALGSLFVASYDSQDYGGGILTRLHTCKRCLLCERYGTHRYSSYLTGNTLRLRYRAKPAHRYNSYLTGNTLRLRYRAQPVNAVCCENRTEHTHTCAVGGDTLWPQHHNSRSTRPETSVPLLYHLSTLHQV
jgi:hypothetical protein